jgi:hypothetical protein
MNGIVKWLMLTMICTMFALDCIFLLAFKAGAVVVCEKQAANSTSNMTSGSTRLDVQFIDQSTNYPTSWSWDFGDSGTASIENPVRDMQIREPYSYLTQLIQWSDTRT